MSSRGERFDLTEEEAYALLLMCMMSPGKIEGSSEKAIRKLAEFLKNFQQAGDDYDAEEIIA